MPANERLYYDICRQPVHAKFALADGGRTGIGLGAGKEKWQWLSEPHNDFIFAVIGEEIGLIGTLVILALFAAFAYAAYRLVVRSDDFFVRIAATGVMTWIVVQAIINIGAVIGTLPIIGVPLPFVSSGGSSLITSMAAAGMLLAFARAEPGCAEQLAARPRMVRGASTCPRCWRSPIACAPTDPTWPSPRSARPLASKHGWCPLGGTPCTSSPRCHSHVG